MSSTVISLISHERLNTYLKASGFDMDRALRLYAWNMRISASFFPLLCCIEVCLRNRIAPRLVDRFGQGWWNNEELHTIMGGKGKGTVLRTAKSINERGTQRGTTPTSGRMTAELNFGFWVGMLLPKYETELWDDLQTWFPDLPQDQNLSSLQQYAAEIRDLRNRISHHEPIFKRDLTLDYARQLQFLTWTGPQKAAWIRPQLETMKILRQRP
ncbi:MAG: Abi family protein [Rhodobacteraceae bacterium]|nr:Abi family protein [Paracoccaceae bacterium]